MLRYQGRKRPAEFAHGDANLIHTVTDHLERHMGPIETTYHEVISDLVHVDVFFVEPTPGRNFHTLVTCGMSARPMTVPKAARELAHAELMLALPSDWPLGTDEVRDPRHAWPLTWLRRLARFPHEYETWLGMGHTIPNGDPARPFHKA